MGYRLIAPGGRRNNATYIVRGTIGGRRFEARTNATTREAAEYWAIKYVAGLQSGPAAGAVVTFEQATAAYIAFRRPRRDDAKFIDLLSRFFAGKPVREVVGADLVNAAHMLLPNAGNAHKNRSILNNASAVLHYAQEQGWCDERRFRRLPVSRRSNRRPAPADTVRLLLANTEGPKRLLLAWLYETGQRITDSVRLSFDDLDLQAARATIRSSKTDDVGAIDLSPELVALLATGARYAGNRVFPWNSRTSVYKWLVPLRKRLGVTYTPHQSRHALATDLRALGLDMKGIAERGLWADERSAGRYVHHRASATQGRTVGAVLGFKRGKS